MKNVKGFSVVEGLLILVIVGLLGFTGWYVWKTHDKTTDTLNNVDRASNSSPNYSKQVDGKTTSQSDEQVTKVAQAYCEAQLDDANHPLIFKLGTTWPTQKKVAYSKDKKFAVLNAFCNTKAIYDANTGSGTALTLKYVNSTWLVVDEGQMQNPVKVKLFGIPNDFQ